MSLKEGLISELKKGQFSPILFDDVSSHLWDEKIKSKEYYFFHSDLPQYEQEYYQLESIIILMIEFNLIKSPAHTLYFGMQLNISNLRVPTVFIL